MALYVYFTEHCKADAEKHGVTDEVERLVEKLEQDQNTQGLERFPPPYLKKVMGKQGRLVIEEHLRGDDILLCLARYFIRGSSEYSSFYKDPNGYYEKNNVARDDMEAFLEFRRQQPIKARTPLSDTESAYLQHVSVHPHTDDGTFMESYDWFERISQGWAKDYLPRYYDLIEEIESGGIPQEQTIITHDKNANIKILYRHFPELKRTFLVAPIDPKNPKDEAELQEKYSHILKQLEVDVEEIVRSSRRAYPSIITYDETIWVQVQNSVEANLALSPEEEDILKSILLPSTDSPKYPLFINGRPGSGKSTILQYLFSEHFARHIELTKSEASKNPPLYLTYSTPLLEQARSSVENILICGAKALQDNQEILTDAERQETLGQSFRNFRKFLSDQLPHEVKERFASANYIDFEQFRKKWDAKRRKHPVPEVRSIGPELAWHAIRTFIKGMRHNPGSEVDPEFYEIELARDSKSISDATFKSIYQHVWKNWYKDLCEQEGYWDDQDLARAVLEYSADKLPRHPAVFCDEAQDFTTIELELIQRLSLYSDRELPSYLARHVPFAFAGDPFQTLNPTGFNWNAMQSSFHDNIVRQLDSNGSAKLEFNFQELSFNYRSSEHIVKLANLIQLLRAVLLGIKGLRPQQTWTRKATVSPVWFRRDDANFQSVIREQSELVIIIPCQENGELEFVENDSFLSTLALLNGQVSRNILSPARAKGLEYDRVLLYGFGDEARKRVPELLKHISAPDREPPEIERRLGWEYFLNQFYVAVSRARKRLFILDSGEALSEFWAFTEPKKQRELLDLYKNNEEWSLEFLGGTMQGDDSSWLDDRDDPLELAERWRDQGFAQRDAFLLNLAKANFERANRPEKAKLCEAAAYEFSEEFTEAGDLFKALRQSDDACRCYWAGKDAAAVAILVQEFPEIGTDPRYLAANAITRSKNSPGQIDHLLTALKSVEPVPFPDGTGEITAWRWFFEKFISKVIQTIESSEGDSSDWKPSVERILEILRRFGISHKAYPDLAKLYYLVGDSEAALAHWGECSMLRKQDPEWIIRARANAEQYPANLVHLDRLKDHQSIIAAWRTEGSSISDPNPVNLILKSAAQIVDMDAIRTLLPACTDIQGLMTAIQACGDEIVPDLSGAIAVAINKCFEAHSNWGQIVNFAATQKISDGKLNAQLKASGVKLDRSVRIAAAVRVLARSERLSGETSKSQQAISEFLKSHLIVDGNAKQEKQLAMQEIHSLVNMAEVGAAFERAFRLTFALEYYEQWFLKGGTAKRSLSPSAEEVDFAKRRWLLCKNRLGETLEGVRGDEHKEEFRVRGREWNLSVDHEPAYPELAPIAELKISSHTKESPKPEIAVEKQKKEKSVPAMSASAQLLVGDLKFSVMVQMRKQRIVITREDTEDQIICGPDKVSSDDVPVGTTEDTTIKAWIVKKWGIRCEIVPSQGAFIIRLKTSEGNPILGFELPEFKFLEKCAN